jgi:hypothetical protein
MTRSPSRFLLALIGGLIVIGMVLLGAWTLLNLAGRHTFDARSSFRGLTSLKVESGSGDVHLTSAPEGSAMVVVAHVTEDLTSPHRQALRQPGGVLQLTDSCGSILNTQCSVSYDISVPKGVKVDAGSGAGDVTAIGLTTDASIDLHSGAGDVTATTVGAAVIRLSSGAGDVDGQLTRVASNLDASSGAGDVTLTVPNASYAVRAESGAGTVSDSSLRIDPTSPFRISATSGAGNVTIKTR